MDKLKRNLRGIMLIGLFILAIPFFVILLACGLLLYVIINAMGDVVCDIWEEDLTEAWNEMIVSIGDCMNDIKELFLMEMELE
jgi:hypothetical protein